MPGPGSAPTKLQGGAGFRRVLERGSRAAGKLVVVHALRGERETRIGFIAGRSVGGAVQRNRARRLLREASRMVDPAVRPGTHLVFVARSGIPTARAAEVAAEMAALLRKLGETSEND